MEVPLSSAIAARSLRRPARRQAFLIRFFVMAITALGLAGCNVELSTDLDQRDANEIIAALFRHNIAAERVMVKGGKYTVSVDESRFSEAINIMNESGLPKQQFDTMCMTFKKEGLVSSPVQERAQMICALQGELAKTISDIDGVISARVHLVLPENDPLRQQLVPSSASVFIRHQSNVVMSDLLPQVKLLVANGVAGLSYDKVSVVLVPVEAQERQPAAGSPAMNGDAAYTEFMGMWMHRDSIAQAAWLIYGLIFLVLLLGGGLGVLMWNQRQRIYPLQSAGRMK
jgi:type III secretion protein J